MLPSFPKGRYTAMHSRFTVLGAGLSNHASPSAGSLGEALFLTFAYSLLGIVVFAIGFAIIAKLAPFSIRKEIEEDQNVALAILIGAVILGLSIIIASAVGG